ncbi:MAG: dTDP-4-amino-4,6-dideoxygalactose transaminase [Reyranella sp.]|nr:dTDP-4-amino-4,6-dideoxygalactose transaminase [Reyranella sp.]
MTDAVAFSKTTTSAAALDYLRAALESGDISGDGPFTRRCHEALAGVLAAPALLTHSCTAALEMAALLLGLRPGDEVIMPSFTFVSTANAFVLRGAVPVFIDIRADTFNMDESLIAAALSPRTRAIVPVHYAGIACDMDAISVIARAPGAMVIEDAAQAWLSRYKGRPLGTLGTLGCFSFHATKNIVSGEGGALVVNDPDLLERAQIVREKGTNRTQFRQSVVQKYEWLDIGSSYLPSDLLAALLLSQLEAGETLTHRRLEIWNLYHAAFAEAERTGLARRPIVPADCTHNGHIYSLLLRDAAAASRFRAGMQRAGIPCPPHYVPLHSAPAGRRFCRVASSMEVTDNVASCLARLPLHAELSEAQVAHVIAAVLRELASA